MALSILLLCAPGQFSRAWAIDVYHFLVEFKNGRAVERISAESPESYEHLFESYVSKTKLIEKREYSVNEFIQTFGEDPYEDLMAGYFGFGVEEEIIFNRQTQGLEFNADALPPPDETSIRLMEIWESNGVSGCCCRPWKKRLGISGRHALEAGIPNRYGNPPGPSCGSG